MAQRAQRAHSAPLAQRVLAPLVQQAQLALLDLVELPAQRVQQAHPALLAQRESAQRVQPDLVAPLVLLVLLVPARRALLAQLVQPALLVSLHRFLITRQTRHLR
jgi:hypothetical protein